MILLAREAGYAGDPSLRLKSGCAQDDATRHHTTIRIGWILCVALHFSRGAEYLALGEELPHFSRRGRARNAAPGGEKWGTRFFLKSISHLTFFESRL
jgi:hypothetical protein